MDPALQSRLTAALAPAYEVEAEVGRGGMAIVYRARDTRLKRLVAVKLLPPEMAFRADVRSRFLHEAETAAKLSHPNIVPIYSVDERDGLVYFVMGLVQGESVGDRLRRDGALPLADVRRILREVVDALAYAHDNGVIHRDIKPDNVLLDSTSGRAMVTDFGIARAVTDDGAGASRLTATGAVIGTPAYMSPEQCAGDRDIDGRSDLYSLGAVVYQMLAGDPPFVGGNTPSVMMRQVTEPPVPVRQRRPDVDEQLARIVMKLLAKDPADRFANGQAVVAAIDGAPVGVLAPTARRSLARRDRPVGMAVGTEVGEAIRDAVLQTVTQRVQDKMTRREERRRRRAEKRGEGKTLAERVHRFRGRTLSYVGSSLFLFGINYLTGGGFWWCLFPIFGMALSTLGSMGRLMGEGVPLQSMFSGALPPGLEVQAAAVGGAAPVPALAAAPPAANIDEEVRKGPFGPVLQQAVKDRQVVNDLINGLSQPQRALLPDVKETADALFARIVSLASALQRLEGQVDDDRLKNLDERIGRIEQETEEAADRERRLTLLRRQREKVLELSQSRSKLLEQYESAGLLLQNLSLDLLKVRSSGLDSALSVVTSATQEARALSREIGYVLSAADELREISK